MTTASYTWDGTGKKGLLASVTDVNGRTISYSYNSRNLLSQVSETAGTTSYSFDDGGNTTGITEPNGTTVTRTFDNANRLIGVTNKNSSGTTLSSFSYTLDTDGRRTFVSEADGSTVSYGYDWGGRLTSEIRTGTNPFSVTYALDGAGNRTSQTVGSATTTFTLNTDDQLTATSSSSGGFVNSYSYNDNGEQTGRTLSGTAYSLAYDYDGQLTSITQGSSVTSFGYDASGRRVTRTSGGVTTRFYYDAGQILAEKQGSTTSAVYTYGQGFIRKDGEYPLFDGLGSERTVTNASLTVTGTINFDGFGNTVGSTGSSSNSYTFAATSGYRNPLILSVLIGAFVMPKRTYFDVIVLAVAGIIGAILTVTVTVLNRGDDVNNRPSIDDRRHFALEARRAERLEEARHEFEMLVIEQPNHWPMRTEYADTLLQCRRFHDAEVQYQLLASMHFLGAKQVGTSGHRAVAKQSVTRDDLPEKIGYADMLLRQGRFLEAKIHYRSLVSYPDPNARRVGVDGLNAVRLRSRIRELQKR